MLQDDLTRLEAARQAASDAFWAEVALRYPEVKSGDFGPLETVAWDTACMDAIITWLRNNQPITVRRAPAWTLEEGDLILLPSGRVRRVRGVSTSAKLTNLTLDSPAGLPEGKHVNHLAAVERVMEELA